jgi:hypothetical protein
MNFPTTWAVLPLFFHKCFLTDKESASIPTFGQQKVLPSLVVVWGIAQLQTCAFPESNKTNCFVSKH